MTLYNRQMVTKLANSDLVKKAPKMADGHRVAILTYAHSVSWSIGGAELKEGDTPQEAGQESLTFIILFVLSG